MKAFGTYEIRIKGKIEHLCFTSTYRNCLRKVKQWGTLGMKYIDFYNCDYLTEIALPTKGSFKELEDIRFESCENLTSIPDKLFENCPKLIEFNNTFKDCTGLTDIPERLFYKCYNAKSFDWTFWGCTGLTNISENLFVNCENVESFNQTFRECTNYQGNPIKLWERVENGSMTNYEGIPDGEGCFYNCINLNGYYEIPEYWRREIEIIM